MKKEKKIKVRKKDFIDTSTIAFSSKKYKLKEIKYNWRNELWKELSEEDIKKLGIEF